MRKHWLVLMAATLTLGGVPLLGGHFARATTPTETPRPTDFTRVEIVAPRHGDVFKAPPASAVVRVHQPQGAAQVGLQLRFQFDGQDLDRQGRVTSGSISLQPGEREIAVPLALKGNGVYTLEAYLTEFVPFSNRELIRFGVNNGGGAR